MDTSKLLAAKIAQLELDKAGERDQEAEIDREVKKATRDLSNLLSNIDSPMTKLDVVQKKYSELLADMRRLDRANTKNKKRADQLQKEKDQGRTELSRSVSMKEKLEKLCRELQRENKKMKVGVVEEVEFHLILRGRTADSAILMQEEHRSLVETEKRGREELNETFDGVLWEIQTVISQKEDPSSQKLNMETDELWVPFV